MSLQIEMMNHSQRNLRRLKLKRLKKENLLKMVSTKDNILLRGADSCLSKNRETFLVIRENLLMEYLWIPYF
jgi:hypothetical protein